MSTSPVLHLNLAQALFAPRGIALLGASGDAAKHTARPLRFLRKHGYTGRIVPINASRSEVLGERAWPSLAEAPGEIDHAFVMMRGESVEQALEECGARGIPVVTILSGGFADAGVEGAARQSRLVARARALGVRLLGPNSMGVIDIPGASRLPSTPCSRSMRCRRAPRAWYRRAAPCSERCSRAAPLEGWDLPSSFRSATKRTWVSVSWWSMLVEDPATQVILLFLETVRDSARLAAAARKAHAAGKPVVAYKLGRSRLGEALAHSHTGALAGSTRRSMPIFAIAASSGWTCSKR